MTKFHILLNITNDISDVHGEELTSLGLKMVHLHLEFRLLFLLFKKVMKHVGLVFYEFVSLFRELSCVFVEVLDYLVLRLDDHLQQLGFRELVAN